MLPDLRVCFVGDSFVAGVGDPEHLGWAGRVAARTHRSGPPLTAYNLGIRRNTSDDVLGRWRAECLPRFPHGCTSAIALSFGVNDTMVEGGRRRVPADRSAANLVTLLDEIPSATGPVLVIGPVPVADE
ncbi:G-D-S-L family lipolytic protein, partial [Amycolatopsis rhizosphaerae]